eukprot:1597390-Amphidinium_carterae.1
MINAKGLLTHELGGVPAGARLLTRDKVSALGFRLMLRFGVFFEPCQFVITAARKQHPFLLDSGLPSVTLHSLRVYLGSAPHEVVAMRAEQLRSWATLKARCADSGRFSDIDPSIVGILGNKDFAFWESALMEVNYPEVEIVAESARGFALTGSANMSPVFPPDVRVSGSSEFDLRA